MTSPYHFKAISIGNEIIAALATGIKTGYYFNSCILSITGPSRCMVLASVLLVLLSTSIVSGAPSRTRKTPSHRWQRPCGGKTPVEEDLADIWEVFEEEVFEVDPEQMAMSYHDMARKATVVKDKIFQLRDKMVSFC
jgi:hypothetical protein